MKLLRQLLVWFRRRDRPAVAPTPPPPVDLAERFQTRVVSFSERWYAIEYRRAGSGLWIRLTKAFTGTDNPNSWLLTQAWLFPSYGDAARFAMTITEPWLLNHLRADREAFLIKKRAVAGSRP